MQSKPHMKRFDNRPVIVTGGAPGMGASHARGFVAEGANVVIADAFEQAGRTLADELGRSASERSRLGAPCRSINACPVVPEQLPDLNPRPSALAQAPDHVRELIDRLKALGIQDVSPGLVMSGVKRLPGHAPGVERS